MPITVIPTIAPIRMCRRRLAINPTRKAGAAFQGLPSNAIAMNGSNPKEAPYSNSTMT